MSDYLQQRRKLSTPTPESQRTLPVTPGFAPTPTLQQAIPAQDTAQTDRTQNDAISETGYGHHFSQIAIYPPSVGVQAKLTVNRPGDIYEQEADRVAEQVLQSDEDTIAPKLYERATHTPIQRCATCSDSEPDAPLCPTCATAHAQVQTKPLSALITPFVLRAPIEQQEQTPAIPSLLQSPRSLEHRLHETKGSGSPLPTQVRAFMEPRFGADFSQVRVHTDSSAVQMSRELNAQAFTHQHDLYYGAGRAPATDALTAHELTHVLQQTGGVQAKTTVKTVEEDSIQSKPDLSRVIEPRIQRWPFDDEEEETSSSGGVLDWVSEQAGSAASAVSDAGSWAAEQGGAAVDAVSEAGSSAYDWAAEQGSAAVDAVTEAGSSAVDWASEQGSAAVDAVTEAGSSAVDWASEQGSAAVDAVTEAGSSAVDWATDKAREYGNELVAQKKAAVLGQLSQLMQKFAGDGGFYITDSQLGTINGHLASLSGATQGAIALGGISAEAIPDDTGEAAGKKVVSAATIQGLLQQLQSSLSASLFSPEPSAGETGEAQGSIQRAAIAAPLVPAIGLGALAIMALKALAIILLVLAVLWLLSKARDYILEARGRGNVADTGIMQEVQALIAAGLAANICAALAMLMASAESARDSGRIQRIKATQKAKGCRHSRNI